MLLMKLTTTNFEQDIPQQLKKLSKIYSNLARLCPLNSFMYELIKLDPLVIKRIILFCRNSLMFTLGFIFFLYVGQLVLIETLLSITSNFENALHNVLQSNYSTCTVKDI